MVGEEGQGEFSFWHTDLRYPRSNQAEWVVGHWIVGLELLRKVLAKIEVWKTSAYKWVAIHEVTIEICEKWGKNMS